MKKNCWEYKKCGRQYGGEKVAEFGVCPATINTTLSGVHEGKNGGRACWIVAGTFCKGTVQGTFAQKFKSCQECDFYQDVRKAEGIQFVPAAALIAQSEGRTIERPLPGTVKRR